MKMDGRICKYRLDGVEALQDRTRKMFMKYAVLGQLLSQRKILRSTERRPIVL